MSRKAQPLDALLDLVYLAAADSSAWPEFLHSAARLFDARIAAIISQAPGGTRYSTFACTGLSEEGLRDYNDYYVNIDPWNLSLQRQAINEFIGPGTALCPSSQFGDTEFYIDHWRKHTDCWYQGGIIHQVAGVSSVLSFHRTRHRGDFSQSDLHLFRSLLPHVSRALAVHRKVVDLRTSVTQAAGAVDALDVGLLGLGQNRKIRFANTYAETLLGRGDILAAKNGHLIARDSRAQSSLDHLLLNAFGRSLSTPAGGAIAISHGDRSLLVTVLPANRYLAAVPEQTTLLLLIVDPEARPRSRTRLLSVLFGLTPAETRVVMLLLQGLDPNEISGRTQTTPGTVRFQLKAIYRKTGVSRQSQLVRLVSRLPGIDLPE